MSITNHPVKVVIFDMDKTLLSGDSMERWHQFLAERGVTTESDKQTRKRLHDEYLDGSLDINENFKFEFLLLNRIPVSQRSSWQQHFFENHLKLMVSKIALDLIENYKKENAIIILSTSSMRFIADPVAAFIKADFLLATDGYVSQDVYTGKTFDPPNYREGKKTNFLNWLWNSQITLKEIIFYTDSINDIDLLLN